MGWLAEGRALVHVSPEVVNSVTSLFMDAPERGSRKDPRTP
jgi:hypothetical protein